MRPGRFLRSQGRPWLRLGRIRGHVYRTGTTAARKGTGRAYHQPDRRFEDIASPAYYDLSRRSHHSGDNRRCTFSPRHLPKVRDECHRILRSFLTQGTQASIGHCTQLVPRVRHRESASP